MLKITLGILFFIATSCFSQEQRSTNKGSIVFEASIAYLEEVKAQNESVACELDVKTGKLTCTVWIKKFKFKRDLMYEHFNDHYIESDKYPKATLKATIDKFDLKTLTPTAIEYTVKGKFSIHGRQKIISLPAMIKTTPKGIELNCNFILNTDDFKIKIPTTVLPKISKNVSTTVKLVLN